MAKSVVKCILLERVYWGNEPRQRLIAPRSLANPTVCFAIEEGNKAAFQTAVRTNIPNWDVPLWDLAII